MLGDSEVVHLPSHTQVRIGLSAKVRFIEDFEVSPDIDHVLESALMYLTYTGAEYAGK